jgi:hypothetical protein
MFGRKSPWYYNIKKSVLRYTATFDMIVRCKGLTGASADWWVDIGETLAAATERESKLRFEQSF